jgi:hypothetical protein
MRLRRFGLTSLYFQHYLTPSKKENKIRLDESWHDIIELI